MKRLIEILILAVIFIFTLQAQSNNIDETITGIDSYKFKMTATIDTALFIFSKSPRYDYFTISVKSDAADTITVKTLSRDGTAWIQHAVIDMSSYATVSTIAIATTYKEFAVIDPAPLKIMIISASDDASYDSVIVAGKYGILPSGTAMSGTIVSVENDNIKSDTVSISLPTGGAAAPLHAIGDVVGQSLTAGSCYLLKLPNAARNTNGSGAGSGGYITHIYVETDSIPAGTILATLETDTAGMTYIADNAAFAPTYNMGKNVVGTVVLSFTTQGTNGTGRSMAEASCLIPYTCIAGSQALYLRISCITAVTFKYGGSLFFRVSYDRN